MTDRARYLAHLNIMWGFILLVVTTTSVAAGVYLFHQETPYALSNPIKWIGNIGGLALVAGSLLAIFHRLSERDGCRERDILRLAFPDRRSLSGPHGSLRRRCSGSPDVAGLAYPVYFAHLVFVWFLFAYLPFSKFAHFLYRLCALVFAQATGRELSRAALPYALAQARTGPAGI